MSVAEVAAQLQAVLNRQQAMEAEMARLQGQNQVLSAAGLEQMPQLIASLNQQVTQQSG